MQITRTTKRFSTYTRCCKEWGVKSKRANGSRWQFIALLQKNFFRKRAKGVNHALTVAYAHAPDAVLQGSPAIQ
ncbi:hypothetical protein C6B01_11525 [Escherichia coli]|nr:hypothetical protein [Escherichia coli]EFN7977633.1 hypothetical protein [Escherichia coli]EFO3074299.1 hypothetical protein [Escherichia coli]RCC34370.1 hypothetical protein C6B01_11525 [Escherichia coli]RCC90721.1 hypothetical protein C6B26_13205 [Escherichia coli]